MSQPKPKKEPLALAVDISNWSGTISPDAVAAWQAQGIEKVVVGTQNIHIARQQMKVVKDAGLELEAYVYLYGHLGASAQIHDAMDTIAGFSVDRLWLDVEDEKSGKTPEQWIEFLGLAIAISTVAFEYGLGVYTRAAYWRQHLGNTTLFRHLPLWNAWYMGKPNLDDFTPYGGWSREEMRQYTNTQTLAGVQVCRDVYRTKEAA